MRKEIKKHFQKADPILFKVIQGIENLEELAPRLRKDYFLSLCKQIINQQLSGHAADKIFGRFIELFPNKKITPKYLLKLSDDSIRNIGASWAKVKYLKDLARKVEDKEIYLERLPQFTNEEVIIELTKIKGIGTWTAEMFLMFSLGREDVFSHGDLGLRRSIEKIYNISNPTRKKIETLSLKWAPFRTWACRILWSYRDNA